MNAIGWIAAPELGGAFCTATIISPSAVITAKHCFEDARVQNSSELNFNVSTSDNGVSSDGRFDFDIRAVDVNRSLDIAIITFPLNPFQNLQNVRPLPINRSPIEGAFYDNLIGQQVTAAGYGTTYESNQRGRYYASVRVELITSRTLVVNGERRQGICTGDSGGPLIAPGVDGKPTVLAVVSKGDPCCAGIDQITRLDPASDWIDGLSFARESLGNWSAACAGLSPLGSCSDNRLRRCEGGQLSESDCGQQVCDYDIPNQRVSCITPCAGIPPQGVCSGSQTLLRCVRGQREEVPCDAESFCERIENGDTFACVSPYTFDELDDEVIPSCIPNEENIITEASEARFVATSSCQQGSAPPALLSLLALLWALRYGLSFLRLKASIGSSFV